MLRDLYIFNLYGVRTIINNLSLTEQRIWDAMMLFAHENLMTKQIHKISLETLSNCLINKNQAMILNKLNGMRKEQVCENILDSRYLGYYFEDIKIIDSEIFYEYPYHLRVLFSNKLENDFLKKSTAIDFDSRYSIFLYRFFYVVNLLGYIKVIPICGLRRFLDIKPNQYADPKYFFNKVLVKAFYEINEKTDLIVNMKPVKEGKAIIAFKLTAKYKIKPTVENFTIEELLTFVMQNLAFFKVFYTTGKITTSIDSDFVNKYISQEDQQIIANLILGERNQ